MLIPKIVSDYFRPYFVANRMDKVTIVPSFSAPALFLYLWELLEHYVGGDTFSHLLYFRRRILRRNNQKQMYMVVHDFHRIYFQIVMFGYLTKDFFQSFRHPSVEQFFTIFLYPYKMVREIIDIMPASSQWAHGPYCIRKSSPLGQDILFI